uniref:Uncharacterized protein n=1 Tax=Oryza nivara TaxID=4536 RepID=A0A0E0IWK9_ORYNI
MGWYEQALSFTSEDSVFGLYYDCSAHMDTLQSCSGVQKSKKREETGTFRYTLFDASRVLFSAVHDN